MKNIILFLISVLIIPAGFAQGLMFNISGTNAKSIKKDQLYKALTLIDITEQYPSSWISQYDSVSIQTAANGVHLIAHNLNDTLSEEQKKILSLADIGTVVTINIHHHYANPVTEDLEPRTIHFGYTVVPEVQAEFPGGEEQLNAFLEAYAIEKIPLSISQKFDQAIIGFIITETGSISNAFIEKSSGDSSIDDLLLSAINKMPSWQPAENIDGVKVKQKFQFTVGYPGC